MGIRATHEYTFTVDGYNTDTDEFIAALQQAQQAIGSPTHVSFSYYAGDQREPSQLTVKVRPKR